MAAINPEDEDMLQHLRRFFEEQWEEKEKRSKLAWEEHEKKMKSMLAPLMNKQEEQLREILQIQSQVSTQNLGYKQENVEKSSFEKEKLETHFDSLKSSNPANPFPPKSIITGNTSHNPDNNPYTQKFKTKPSPLMPLSLTYNTSTNHIPIKLSKNSIKTTPETAKTHHKTPPMNSTNPISTKHHKPTYTQLKPMPYKPIDFSDPHSYMLNIHKSNHINTPTINFADLKSNLHDHKTRFKKQQAWNIDISAFTHANSVQKQQKHTCLKCHQFLDYIPRCKQKGLKMTWSNQGRLPSFKVMERRMVNPQYYLDVSIGGEVEGRGVEQLFKDVAPKTAENFRTLCSNEKGIGTNIGVPLHYKGARFHRVIKGFVTQGGDISAEDETRGESIYGLKFEAENFGSGMWWHACVSACTILPISKTEDIRCKAQRLKRIQIPLILERTMLLNKIIHLYKNMLQSGDFQSSNFVLGPSTNFIAGAAASCTTLILIYLLDIAHNKLAADLGRTDIRHLKWFIDGHHQHNMDLPLMAEEGAWVTEIVLHRRLVKKGLAADTLVLAKWKGKPDRDSTWEYYFDLSLKVRELPLGSRTSEGGEDNVRGLGFAMLVEDREKTKLRKLLSVLSEDDISSEGLNIVVGLAIMIARSGPFGLRPID